MHILLLNLGMKSAQDVKQALSGQGYEITTGRTRTVDEIRVLFPEVLITEATPSDLSCCGLISQIKADPDLRTLKIVIIIHGGALERTRALDLGADDVISFPFEPLEFAARIRTQFRERQPELELEAKLNDALQREHLAESAVEALSDGMNAKRGFRLLPAIYVLSAIVVLPALATIISNRHSRKDTLQLKAEVAQLNGGILQQGELLRRTEQARASLNASDASVIRESLKAQTEELRREIAANSDTDGESLKRQLQETQNRVGRLEDEDRVAETIVHRYGPSICLLHVVVGFRDKDSGQLIRISADATDKAGVDDLGMVSLGTGGTGPPLQLDVFGTGFLVARDGRLVTNHHVAEPWWSNENLKQLLDGGAVAYAVSYTAYFPGTLQGIAAKLDRISPHADLATLKLQAPAPPHTALVEFDDRSEASVAGDPVVLIGYPTGIEGILARGGDDVAQKVVGNTQEMTQIVSQLAAQDLIRPTTTQGHIGDVLKGEIIYDAATTSGGSGGPLFNRDGKVIGVNRAMLSDFGGSNMAVPIRYADELVK
ncbi:trypsin-like peptidase domain-containing protein [Alloacidobacterium dinghuense]|uniref:Trypsin-like peptidase domain-containing protein n=1 Tax=Alloacidobacterium dinghuense TaxID=2763107 RepID=A0A7G8BNX7_9BACT|nr:trypsin-like peptidase domain-containing protein [Alloacidobacterium dinghuense]QNI34247.1 trypsin-like peptidase domain-containing protein [Alloacidobacterium dinghuense]